MKNYGEYTGPRTSEGWKLKERHSEDEFFSYLFDNDVPHENVLEDIWRLRPEVKSALEKAGWEFEEYEIKNIGKLPLEERNKIKKESKSPERREKVMKELFEKYGD